MSTIEQLVAQLSNDGVVTMRFTREHGVTHWMVGWVSMDGSRQRALGSYLSLEQALINLRDWLRDEPSVHATGPDDIPTVPVGGDLLGGETDAAVSMRRTDPCRSDGRCQYAIDHGTEGMGHCPKGKCAMPVYSGIIGGDL